MRDRGSGGGDDDLGDALGEGAELHRRQEPQQVVGDRLLVGQLAGRRRVERDTRQSGEGLLPPMVVGQALQVANLGARQSFNRPPARYNEASLVRTLEEMGIGRPSTYAPTIDTIQQRGYVVKEDREGKEREYRQLTLSGGELKAETLTEMAGSEKNKLFPTDIAGIVIAWPNVSGSQSRGWSSGVRPKCSARYRRV